MHAGLLQSAFMAIIPNGMIATASGKLLPIHRAKQPIIPISATIFQILLNDFDNILIQWDNQRFSVLCGIHIYNRIVKIYILDFDIHKTVLPNASRKQEIDNDPTAIG